MESHQTYISHQLITSNSVTSAVDLPVPRTPSPSLVVEPDHSNPKSSLAKRRSWGNNKLREAGRMEDSSGHPLHLDFDSNMSPRRGLGGNDPFFSSKLEHPIPHFTNDVYSDSRASTSFASLSYGNLEDDTEDEAHLTANMSRTGTATLLLEDDTSSIIPKTPEYSSDDLEIEGGSTPRARRRTVRYSHTPSPLKKTETTLKSVSKSLRRISLRVVNLANTEFEGHLRLGDGHEDGSNKRLASEDQEDDGPFQPDLSKVSPIRGRTLGFLGDKSKIRLALFQFLVYECVFLFYSPKYLIKNVLVDCTGGRNLLF